MGLKGEAGEGMALDGEGVEDVPESGEPLDSGLGVVGLNLLVTLGEVRVRLLAELVEAVSGALVVRGIIASLRPVNSRIKLPSRFLGLIAFSPLAVSS